MARAVAATKSAKNPTHIQYLRPAPPKGLVMSMKHEQPLTYSPSLVTDHHPDFNYIICETELKDGRSRCFIHLADYFNRIAMQNSVCELTMSVRPSVCVRQQFG